MVENLKKLATLIKDPSLKRQVETKLRGFSLIRTELNLEEYTQTDILVIGLIEYDQDLFPNKK